MRNHGPDTVPSWCCLVCLAVLRRHWTQQVQKMRLLFARNHALHPWTLSICVDVCSRRGCVDSIWLWVRKRTVSKPVFGVSKTSISGFVAVGPHCIRNWKMRVSLLGNSLNYEKFLQKTWKTKTSKRWEKNGWSTDSSVIRPHRRGITSIFVGKSSLMND